MHSAASATCGHDKLYLQAEALQRKSDLAAAADALSCVIVVSHFVPFLQALMSCRRWPDALSSISNLRPGVDKLYLQAEALWRQSDLTAAADALSHARQLDHSSSKCADLQLWVESLQKRFDAADAAFEDGKQLGLPFLCCS